MCGVDSPKYHAPGIHTHQNSLIGTQLNAYYKELYKMLSGSYKNKILFYIIPEYHKFLVLFSENNNLFPSKLIDEIWHTNMQNESLYEKICYEICGRTLEYPIHMSNENKIQGLHLTKQLYGTITPILGKIWDEPKVYTSDQMIQKALYPDMDIFVRTISGKTIMIGVCLRTTIANVCKIINKKIGYKQSATLIYAGRKLNCHNTVAECSITKNSTLHMVLNMSGC
jgi:hypothetical protein